MINSGCCELMEIFEITIGTTKKIIDSAEQLKELSGINSEIKEQWKEMFGQGAFYFSFLLVDKLWKEDRLCLEKCQEKYLLMQRNFESIFSKKTKA